MITKDKTNPTPRPKESIREQEGIDLTFTYADCPRCDEVLSAPSVPQAWGKLVTHLASKCRTGLRGRK